MAYVYSIICSQSRFIGERRFTEEFIEILLELDAPSFGPSSQSKPFPRHQLLWHYYRVQYSEHFYTFFKNDFYTFFLGR